MAFATPSSTGVPKYQLVLGTTRDPLDRMFVDVRPHDNLTPEHGEQLVQQVVDTLVAHPDLTFIEVTKTAETTAYGTPTP